MRAAIRRFIKSIANRAFDGRAMARATKPIDRSS